MFQIENVRSNVKLQYTSVVEVNVNVCYCAHVASWYKSIDKHLFIYLC